MCLNGVDLTDSVRGVDLSLHCYSFMTIVGFAFCSIQQQLFFTHHVLANSMRVGSGLNHFPSLLVVAAILLRLSASAQWMQTSAPSGGEVLVLAASGTNLFAGTYGGGVFLSTDNGAGWTALNNGLANTYVPALTFHGTYLFAGTEGGIFRSSNNGAEWFLASQVLTPVQAFASSESSLFVAQFGVVSWTNDLGVVWSVGNRLPNLAVTSLAVLDTLLFAGMYREPQTGIPRGGVCVSIDNGTTWSSQGIPSRIVYALVAVSSTVCAGTDIGVFCSTDGGANWIPSNEGLSGTHVSAFAVTGRHLFAAVDTSIFLSLSGSAKWTDVSDGLPPVTFRKLTVGGGYLFAATMYNGIWRRRLSEMTTAVKPLSSTLPNEFLLRQNYPNPFNPSTTIKYELPKSSGVRLSVYDMLGREVCVVVKERRDAGVHEAKFEASSLSTGVYFYRLQVGEFVATKRMHLLR
jgi:hypothetical protein